MADRTGFCKIMGRGGPGFAIFPRMYYSYLGLLGKIGHFRQGRTRAYEHRLGPNSVQYAVSQKTNHAAPCA